MCQISVDLIRYYIRLIGFVEIQLALKELIFGKKMNDTISNLLLPTFSNAQRFLVTLLCEYYEDKQTKENRELAELFDENKLLRDEMKKLRTQMRVLREDNRNLSSKLRSANNMIRILTKTRESADECKTPTRLNILDVETLLKEKINKKALVSSSINSNLKKVQFDFRKPTSNLNDKANKVTKQNNKSILKSKNDEEQNKLKNILKKIENKKSTTAGYTQDKPRMLTNRKNVTAKNAPTEKKKTERSGNAVQKSKENRKKIIPNQASTTRVQPNREVKKPHLEPLYRSRKQDNKINNETFVIE